MNLFYKYIIQNKDCREIKSSWIGWITILVLFVSLGLHLWRLGDRYYFPHETGFQELIAKRHLDPGLTVTKGLSSLNNLGPEPTYHLTHPPALQLTLALLYGIFGVSEQTGRLLPLASFVLSFFGLWLLVRHRLSPMGCLAALTAFAFAPLAFYSGHIINFEPVVLVCVIGIAVLTDPPESPLDWRKRVALGLLTVYGTLIDWPFTIFMTVLFILSHFRKDRDRVWRIRIASVWLLSVLVCVMYFCVVCSAGMLSTLFHHASVHSGIKPQADEIRWPLFVSLGWWWTSFKRLWFEGSPILLGTASIALVLSLPGQRWRTGVFHWFWVFGTFVFAYFIAFSQATYNPTHYWCLFLFAPVLCLSFGIVIDRLRFPVQWVLLIAFMAMALPGSYQKLVRYPQVPAIQFGRAIAAATAYLPDERRRALEGPLLYTSKVDSIPYYSNCETAFFTRAVRVSASDRFINLHRPEFVTLCGDMMSRFTDLMDQLVALDEILQKSYTLTHEQYDVQLWESLESPHLSLMGMLKDGAGNPPRRFMLEDSDDVHVCAAVSPGNPAIRIDLRPIPKPGRRWLHGWVIAQDNKSDDPITVDVKAGNGHLLGTIQAFIQGSSPRWQPFWLSIGDLPDEITFTWDRVALKWGDLRLMSETLLANDLVQVLAGEIRRRLAPGTNNYSTTMSVVSGDRRILAAYQHPGFGVDRIELPPIRIGYRKALRLEYGIDPAVAEKSDGVDYRIHAWDSAREQQITILNDSLRPKERPLDRVWQVRTIDLTLYSRHVVRFTFEVASGPKNDYANDHALWLQARLVDY